MSPFALIETSAWIHALRDNGDPAVRLRVEEAVRSGRAAWCEMNRVELWAGARGNKENKTLNGFDQFVHRLPIDAATWQLACDVARSARANGLNVPAADVIIFACARRHDAEIVHAYAHFDRLAALPS